ncbi:MAG: M48 family metallopeptidase [Patescibacteria group bacterium]|nr:M48 family metallopeptidase [Patescibacteria group bacterium]
MTLYTHISSNLRKTWLLISLFFLFIIALGWLFAYLYQSQEILIFAIIFSFLMNFLSYWFSDKIVLTLSRAKEIKKSEAPELYRLVENLSITAGLPLPKIYIIDEAAPNAFATGRDKNHAVIAVTRGLLEKLEKVELEGVLAHELAHIGNRDMFLQTIVVVLAGIIAMLSHLFLRMNFLSGLTRRRDNRQSGYLGLILFILFVIAVILAPIAATLIRLAISRKREFLADASGVMLTRYPEGLARALEKISADQTPLRVAHEATAHLYITNPFKGKQAIDWLTKLFSTHPPVEERIKVLRAMNL